ncbi:MAG: insulinase family protein [Gemmatimonadota bacterium]|nr:insulinase family protein [Gemmatimonadota bacterium]
MRPELLPRPLLGPPPSPRVPRPERWTLPNGLRVLAAPRAGLPQVVLRLVIPAGSAADPAHFPGTASLVGSLLTEGTVHRDADALNMQIDRLGACLGVHVGHDLAAVEMVLLADTLGPGVELLADATLHPAFPAPEIERVRAETLDGIQARADEPANLADDRTAEELFGLRHPYGRPVWGSAEAVSAVPAQVLRAFHGAHFRPEGSFLVASGEFGLDELARIAEHVFAGWHGTAPQPGVPVPDSLPRAAGQRVSLAWDDATQAEIRVAGVGLARRSPDWIPAAVANYILGGSTITSRLGANLREDKGWTYGVSSSFADGLQPAGWGVETAVDVEVADEALGEIHRELLKVAQEPVRPEELRRAKDALILSLPRAFETPGRVASRLATLEAHALPYDHWERLPAQIEAVSADDVQRIAAEHFGPERLVSVVVGSTGEGG